MIKVTVITFSLALLTSVNLVAQTDTVKINATTPDLEAEKAYNMGVESFSKKDFKSAVDYYSKAIELKKDFDNAWFNRSSAKMELKDFDGAIADVNQYIQLHPALEQGYYQRAQINYQNNKKDSA
ncbi:MAG: hypothetical protein IT239_06370, partial [Bacteroidia bacterium]|nr:hypothetical protein [Bacteroidia bacterium]